MASGPNTHSSLEKLLGGFQERITLLERRLAVQSGNSAGGNGPSAVGVLAPGYKGGGPATVSVLGGPPLTVQASWATTYVPNLSRSVSLARNGDSWVILGQTDMNADGSGFYALATQPGWGAYNYMNQDRNWNDRIGATRLPTGLIVLSGLLRSNFTPGAGSLIGTLNDPLTWPEHDVMLPVEVADLAYSIIIRTNGRMEVHGAQPANQYLNLDGTAYWAKDSEATGNWINVGQGGSSWGANFEPSPGSTYGPPGFYKDRYGFVWFRGLTQIKTAVTADNTPIIVLPAGYHGHLDHHLRGTGMGGFAGFGTAGTSLNWKGGSPSAVGNYLSLYNISITTADALTINEWLGPYSFLNGWVNYSPATFTTFGITRRGDGLVKYKGLIGSGNTGAPIATLTGFPQYYPRARRLILGTIANATRARVDINGDRETDGRLPHTIWPANGASANWTSFDSVFYVP